MAAGTMLPGSPITVGGNNVQVDFTPSAAAFQWFDLPPSLQYTPTQGKFLCLKLAPLQQGTGAEIYYAQEDFRSTSFPTANIDYGNGTGSSTLFRYPVAGIRFEETQPLVQPAAQGSAALGPDPGDAAFLRMQTTSAGQRLAMRFVIPPIGNGGSFRIAGLRVQSSACLAANSNRFRMGLWRASDGQLLQYGFIGAGQTANADQDWGYRDFFFSNSEGSSSSSSSGSASTPVNLSYNVPYYVGFEQLRLGPEIRINVVRVREYNASTYPFYDLDAYPAGRECYAGHWRIPEGGGPVEWVEYKNRRPMFDLILADITGAP